MGLSSPGCQQSIGLMSSGKYGCQGSWHLLGGVSPSTTRRTGKVRKKEAADIPVCTRHVSVHWFIGTGDQTQGLTYRKYGLCHCLSNGESGPWMSLKAWVSMAALWRVNIHLFHSQKAKLPYALILPFSIEGMDLKLIKMKKLGRWRNGSMVKRSCCSSKAPTHGFPEPTSNRAHNLL